MRGNVTWPAQLPGDLPVSIVGGIPIVALDRKDTAKLMIAATRRRGTGCVYPVLMSSANGEVISKCATHGELRAQISEMDVISADGQPLVWASRLFSEVKLPERVATTDLFHDVAELAVSEETTFYVFGAVEDANARACERVKGLYPGLRLVGRSHGYLKGEQLSAKVAEINQLAPDILWVCLGFPLEQQFCLRFRSELPNVAVIKTSGGLLDFLSGTRRRAPRWIQTAGLEWLFRLAQEPSRLFLRYLVTNPHAALLLLTRSR